MSDAVVLEVDGGVANLTLNEPERMNPLTVEIADALASRLDDLEERDDVRCVVVDGAGPAFSAGGDIDRMHARLESDATLDRAVRDLERGVSQAIASLVGSSYPTVAAVDGPAVGAGANLAIACDVVLASESASIGFVFNQVGLTVDAGTSYLLPRVVGVNVAKELVFTGDIVGAERADDLGLFNHVYADERFDEAVTSMVETIATGPSVALRHAKRLLQDGLEKPLERALIDEATAQGIVFDTRDHAEGVEAFLEDREPAFDGR